MLLTYLFPQPYYLINGNIGPHSSYDGEADYLADTLNTFGKGHSMSFLHPGLPITYLSAMIMKLTGIYSIESIILSSRAFLLSLNLVLIYIGSRIVLKQSLSSSLLLFTLFLFFPSGFLLVDHLSPNSILFGLSVLIISLASSLHNKNLFRRLLALSFLLALSISVKYTAVYLMLPILISVLCIKSPDDFNPYKAFKIILQICAFTLIWFSLISISILPFIPFVITQLNSLSSIAVFIFSLDKLSLLLYAIFIVSALILAVKVFRKLDISFSKSYTYTNGLSLLIVFILLIYNFFLYDLIAVGYALRNLIPLLGSAVLFLSYLESRQSFLSNNLLVVSLIFSLIFTLKISFNYLKNEEALKGDLKFSEYLINNSKGYDYLVFYPNDGFSSKYLFSLWADYRYGDIGSSFNFHKNPQYKDKFYEKMRAYNYRYLYNSSPENKRGYIYFNYIMNNRFFLDSHKSIASNQINALTPKDFCSGIHDDFSPLKSSLLIFPSSLVSYITGNDITKDDLANNHIKDLRKRLNNECKIDSSLKKSLYGDQRYYLLSLHLK
mgnify:CR=1 FL=1